MSTRKPIAGAVALFVFSLTLLIVPSISRGDDFNPPPWRGVGPFSTVQAWDFNPPPQNPAPPDGAPTLQQYGNSGGVPTVTFLNMHFTTSGPDGGWVPNDPAGGAMDVFCPNWIDNEPLKYIRVQITAIGNPNTPPVISGVDGTQGSGAVTAGQPISPLTPADPIHFWQDWAIQPNPYFENIHINVPADMFVTQLVVDTISFPEPMAAAGVMAAFPLFRRGRRGEA